MFRPARPGPLRRSRTAGVPSKAGASPPVIFLLAPPPQLSCDLRPACLSPSPAQSSWLLLYAPRMAT
ncbi:hypothetical protein DAI22_10g032800 [Oryza sativa Japonica Group]|nr:hypothetical protein DAI22_10g032800 [Oryza sativa Japonica Group]